MQMKRGKIATLERKKNFFSTTLVLVFFALTWFTSWMVIFSSHYHHSLLFNPFVDPWTDNVIGRLICIGLHVFVIAVFCVSQFFAENVEYCIFKVFTKLWNAVYFDKLWNAVFSDTNIKWYLEAAVPEFDIDEECYELETAEVEGLIVQGCWVTVTETFNEVPKGSLGKVIKIDEDGDAVIDFFTSENCSRNSKTETLVWKCYFRNILVLTQAMVVAFTPRDSQGIFNYFTGVCRGTLGKIIKIDNDFVAQIEFGKASVKAEKDDFLKISVLSQGGLAVGRWVVVMVPFISLVPQEVPKGSLGKVIKINPDGDALINFEGLDKEKMGLRDFPDQCDLTGREQWVYKGDFRNIRVLNPLGLAAQKAEEEAAAARAKVGLPPSASDAELAQAQEEARKKKEEAMRRNQCKICEICMQTFTSKNKLHKHLRSDHPMIEDRGGIVAADETMGREMSQAPPLGANDASAPPPPARATIGHLVSRLGASESALPSESKHSTQPSTDRQGTTVEESLPPPCQSLISNL
jgi:hypothetical protein